MSDLNDNVRIDKYIWAVRLFKTRSIAAEACKKGRVLINGITVKSSRTLKVGAEFSIKQPPIIRSYRVKQTLSKRVGAKLVENYLEEITSADELEKLEIIKIANSGIRDRGTGRPTKRDRRDINDFTG